MTLSDSAVYRTEVWSVRRPRLVWSPDSRVLCHSSSVLWRMCDTLESKSYQQLDRRLASTVWAARHHSNMHHSLSPLAAWKPHHCTSAWRHQLKPTRRNMFIKNQWGTSHVIDTWSATSRASLIKRLIRGKIVLMHVSKPKANTEHLL